MTFWEWLMVVTLFVLGLWLIIDPPGNVVSDPRKSVSAPVIS